MRHTTEIKLANLEDLQESSLDTWFWKTLTSALT